jgi:leader peptidase (prepilin peptidase) / N-methyltransferase
MTDVIDLVTIVVFICDFVTHRLRLTFFVMNRRATEIRNQHVRIEQHGERNEGDDLFETSLRSHGMVYQGASSVLLSIQSAMIPLLCLILLGCACLHLAWIDFRQGIIPDWLNLAIAILGAIRAAAIGGWALAAEVVVEGALIGGVIWLLRWLYFRLRRVQGLGLGDVKLLAASAIWIGIEGVPVQLLIAALSALAAALVLHLVGTRMTRHTALSFGPFLALGLLAAILLQQGDVIN